MTNQLGLKEKSQLSDLLRAARSTRLPFESSPTGRWVCFEGENGRVYVVRDAWGDGCVVLTVSGEGTPPVEHFLRARDAVAAAARRAGGEPAAAFLAYSLPVAG